MKKIIALGDTHGRPYWKQAVKDNPDADLFVFIGDYFDSFEYSAAEQIYNFKEIIEFKKENPDKVVLLIGNHDHHYFPEIGYTGTSGYQSNFALQIGQILDENRQYLQMAYQVDGMLFTHAGLSGMWLSVVLGDDWKLEENQTYADLVNDIWKYKPKAFVFNGRDPYGNDKYQTPIWIRPESLKYAGAGFKRQIIQIVGHTGQNQIDIKGKSTGGRYYFIDTLGTSGEYLVITDKEITSKIIKDEQVENL